MSKKNLSGLLAIPLVTIMLITGCTAPAPSPTDPPKPTVTQSQSPAPEETKEPTLEELPAGSPLTVEDRKALKDVEGVGTYTMTDGSIVLVRTDSPLPEAVVNDASAKLTGMGRENEGVIKGPPGADIGLANKLSNESGRNVFVVVHTIPDVHGVSAPSSPKYLIRPWDGQYHDSLESAQAAAIAKAGGDASTVDFVVINYVN